MTTIPDPVPDPEDERAESPEAPDGWAQPGLFTAEEIPQSSHQIDLPRH